MSRVLADGLRVLQALEHAKKPRTVRELAADLDLSTFAVARFLGVLVEFGYVVAERDPASKQPMQRRPYVYRAVRSR